jgi:hypothetical protein
MTFLMTLGQLRKDEFEAGLLKYLRKWIEDWNQISSIHGTCTIKNSTKHEWATTKTVG